MGLGKETTTNIDKIVSEITYSDDVLVKEFFIQTDGSSTENNYLGGKLHGKNHRSNIKGNRFEWTAKELEERQSTPTDNNPG